MKILSPLKKGERIIIMSTLLFTFFLFLYFFQGLNSIESRTANFTYSFRTEKTNLTASMILEDCRNQSKSIQKMRCVNEYVSEMDQGDWNCVDYYNEHSKLVNSINNLHIVPVRLSCGDKAHRVGIVYSCEPNNQSLTTYFCLQNNWDLEWCGEW